MHKTPLTDLALAAATVCYSAVWNVRKLQRQTRGVFNSSPNNSQSHVDRNKCGLLKMSCSPQVGSLREEVCPCLVLEGRTAQVIFLLLHV